MSIHCYKNMCARTIVFLLVLAGFIASSSTIQAEENKGLQLHVAIRSGDLERVKKLIEEGADVNYLQQGLSPLQTAVCECIPEILKPGCNEELVRQLLCRGADVNRVFPQAKSRKTMLHTVCASPYEKNIPIARILLCFGADPNVRNDEGCTPLTLVAGYEEKKYGLGMAKLLLEFGADPRLPNNKGVTPIDEAECSISHIGVIPCNEKTREVPMNPKMAALMKASGGHSTAKPECSDIDCPNRCKLVVEGPKHKIIPANEKYRNEISFRVECPEELSKEKCPVTITTKTNKGELTACGKTGKKLKIAAQPGEQQTLTYRWKGPTSMKKAQEEVITLLAESPGGKATKTAEFSVGIDLGIKKVKWFAGTDELCPGERPFNVFVEDAFHKDADMAALAKTFDIKPQLKVDKAPGVEDVEWSPTGYGVLTGIVQNIINLAMQYGVELDLEIDDVCNGNQWLIVGGGNLARLKCETKESRDTPSITMQIKGTYKFNATIAHEADSGTANNERDFQARIKEDILLLRFIHEVLFPWVEGCFLNWISDNLLMRIAECSYGLIPALGSDSGPNIVYYSIEALTTCAFEILTADVVLSEFNKSFFKHNVYYHTFLAIGNGFSMMSTECTGQSHIPVLDDWIVPFFSKRSTGAKRASKSATPNPFTMAQAMTRGLKGKVRFVYLDKAGLSRFRVESSKVGRLSKGTLKPPSEKQFKRRWKKNLPMFPKERMLDYDGFVLIPVESDEKLKLRLKGEGKPGGFVVINADSVSYAKFPSKKWSSDVEIDGSGKPKINGKDAESIKVLHTEK
jgi:hypothetical protein